MVGSDIVTLDALDPRTGAVVAERPLERNVDYVLDTLSGTLRFIAVPLPYDELFRRQVVVVRYQYAAGDGGARTTGARLGASFGRGGLGEVNLGYVNDAGGAGNFALLQQNLRLRTALGPARLRPRQLGRRGARRRHRARPARAGTPATPRSAAARA